jgi:hypothetical protein
LVEDKRKLLVSDTDKIAAMNKLNTTSVSLAVTPTVVSTLFSHVCGHD